MKNFITFILFALTFAGLHAQNLDSLTVKPILWVKADSAVLGAEAWQDVSMHGYSLLPSAGTLPAEYNRLNFNKCFFVDNEYFTIDAVSFAENQITAIVVYQTSDTVREQAIWSVRCAGDTLVGLSTQRLLDEKSALHYRDVNDTISIVNTLFRSWKSTTPISEIHPFQLLKADSMGFTGKIAECLLFDSRIANNIIVEYISYLSLKYGITLFQTDYLDYKGDTIWHYTQYPDYTYSIGGIGREDVMGLYQKQSYLLDNKVIVGVDSLALTNKANAALLQDNNYLMWGFDSLLLNRQGEIYFDNGDYFEVYGNGLLQSTHAQPHPLSTFMQVDGSGWEGQIENYYLLIDRSGSGEFNPGDIEFYMPTAVTEEHILHFSNIQWDTDANGIDRFCFTYVPVDTIMKERNFVVHGGTDGKMEQRNNGAAEQWNNGAAESRNLYSVFPNPNRGNFTVAIDYGKIADVRVNIYTPEGKLLQVKTGTGASHYTFPCSVSVAGQYLIEIEGNGEAKTLKVSIVEN